METMNSSATWHPMIGLVDDLGRFHGPAWHTDLTDTGPA